MTGKSGNRSDKMPVNIEENGGERGSRTLGSG